MIQDFQLPAGKKLFFVSDLHLGEPDYQTTRERERKIISWLNSIESEASGIFFLGDVFDFWFEYRHVVPKGFTRLFGKLASITDRGIPVFFFTGNHDMWLFDYLPHELNIPVYKGPQSFKINGVSFHIGHGDGLGPGEIPYKILKWIFANPICQWLFKWIHPNWGFVLANFWSRDSRIRNGLADPFVDTHHERIYQYCLKMEQERHHDYYVFGHRHLTLELSVNEKSKYYNIGEWITERTYGVYDGHSFSLRSFG